MYFFFLFIYIKLFQYRINSDLLSGQVSVKYITADNFRLTVVDHEYYDNS